MIFGEGHLRAVNPNNYLAFCTSISTYNISFSVFSVIGSFVEFQVVLVADVQIATPTRQQVIGSIYEEIIML